MTTTANTVELIIRARDEATATIQRINGELKGLGGGLQGLSSIGSDLADKVLKAEAALAALGAALGALAVKEAATFADSLYLVQKQLGNTGVSIEQAQQDIERLALAYGQNANVVAQSLAGFLAAGYDYANAAKVAEQAMQLMIAGELDAQVATDALTRSIAGFRVPLDEAGDASQRIGDILNKIGDISSGKFEEIVQGFSRVSPVAKDAGWSMEETAAKVAVLVDVFGSGEIAATALKSGLASLLAPSKDAAATLLELGVKTQDANGQQRQSGAILADLATKWQGLSDAQRAQNAVTLFGSEQSGAMSVVLSDWAKSQGYLTQLIDQTTGAVGSMAREVEGKLKLISIATAVAREAWRQFLQHLGGKLVAGDELSGLVQQLGRLGTALKAAVDAGALDPLFVQLRDQFGALSDLFQGVADQLPHAFEGIDWTGLTASIDDLVATATGIFRDLFGDIDLTSVDGLRRAIQGVIDTITSLNRLVDGIVQEFSPFAQAIGEAIRQFNALDDAAKIDFGRALGIAKAINDLKEFGLALVLIGKAGASAADVVARGFGGIKGVFNALQVAFDSIVLASTDMELMLKRVMLAYAEFRSYFAVSGEDKAKYSQRVIELEQDIQRLVQEEQEWAAARDRNLKEMNQGWDQMANGLRGAQDGLNATEAALRRLGQAQQENAGAQSGATGNATALAQAQQTLATLTEQYARALEQAAATGTDASSVIAFYKDQIAAAQAQVTALTTGQQANTQATQATAAAQQQAGAATAQAATQTTALATAQQAAAAAYQAYQAALKSGSSDAAALGRAWQTAAAQAQALGSATQQTATAVTAAATATRQAGAATQTTAVSAQSLASAYQTVHAASAAYNDAVRDNAENVDELKRAWLDAERNVRDLQTAQRAAAQQTAADTAAWEAATQAQVTYGEWSSKSGAAAQQQREDQRALATEVGLAAEEVRTLTMAYDEAAAQARAGAFPVEDMQALEQALETAKSRYQDLKAALDQKPEPVEIPIETTGAEQAQADITALEQPTESQHTIETNAPDALAEIDALDGHDTSSTHTVYVQKVETNASGGPVGAASAATRRPAGFPRPAWSRVPGVGNQDSVPAALPTGAYVLRQAAARYYGPLLARLHTGGLVNTLLTPGERWFNPSTVARHGTGFFDALNRLAIPREALAASLDGLLAPVHRFAAGGAVAAHSASPGARDSLDINLRLGARTVQVQGTRDQATALADLLRELQRGQ